MTFLLLAVAVPAAAPAAASPRAADDDAPMRDLAALVRATSDGGTLRLEAARYRGGVTIDRPMRIVGTRGTVIDGGDRDTVLRVTAPEVSLSRLTIRNSGENLEHEDSGVHVTAPRFSIEDCHFEDTLFSIYLRTAPESLIHNNRIRSKTSVPFTLRGDSIHVYQSSGTTVTDNVADDGRDMIAFFSDDTIFRGNTMRRGRYGLHLMYANRAVVEDNHLLANSTSLYVMYSKDVTVRDNLFAEADGPSGYGMSAKESDLVEVSRNRFVGNRVGVYLDNSPFGGTVTTTFDRNVVAYNIVGVLFEPAVKRNRFVRNSFIDNQEQVSATSGGSLDGNEWTVDGVGNHWSDYAGYDGDGDGIGDIPYRAEGLYDSLTDQHPKLTFFAETPAARALDAAARAFPTLRPEPKAVDTAPLIDPPAMPPLRGAPQQAGALMLVGISLGLTSLAAAIFTRARRPREVMAT